ncbi:MAG TPA: nicotinate-nucleotide adenylyltransferase [Rhodanobacteraceae bacterium]|nr:nicotinate-nucleotide adenylyltransferase [Rhodanobacteraceae bacterium]
MRPLAILGGTFDPVHLGHLRAAWEASEALDAEVRLMPARVPPHRPAPVASAQQRVAMLRAALAGQDRLRLDTRELDRNGPSYTFDTLTALRDEAAARPLVLLIGSDAFAGLPSWHRWRELFALAHFGVLSRPGHLPTLAPELAVETAGREVIGADALHASPAGRVLRIAITQLEISATRIRALLREGREPRWLLPDALFSDPALLAPYRNEAGTGNRE